MKTTALARLAGAALLAAAVSLPTVAATVEVRVDGVITGHVPGPLPTNSGSYVVPGYERMWGAAAPSPFGMGTAAQPYDVLYQNRSLVIADLPVTMKLLIDTALLPALQLGSGPNGSYYDSLLYSWAQSPTLQPYTPWMTGSLTINGVTQTYTGDYGATASLSTNPYSAHSNLTGNFYLQEFTSAAGLQPWQANVFDVSGIGLQFSFTDQVFNGVAMDQNFSISDASSLAGVNAYFNVYETTWINGGRSTLVQDIGRLQVTNFAMQTLGGGGPVASPVPEPASGALMLAGLLVLAARRRRAA